MDSFDHLPLRMFMKAKAYFYKVRIKKETFTLFTYYCLFIYILISAVGWNVARLLHVVGHLSNPWCSTGTYIQQDGCGEGLVLVPRTWQALLPVEYLGGKKTLLEQGGWCEALHPRVELPLALLSGTSGWKLPLETFKIPTKKMEV